MWKVLFVAKSFHKRGGSQVKLRDYVLHCLAHPRLEPRIFFTDAAAYRAEGLWAQVPPSLVEHAIDVARHDLFLVGGRNWRYLPKDLGGRPVINLIQSIGECAPEAREFRYLKRPATRICVSEAVRDAAAPHCNGPAVAIANGISLDLFRPRPERAARSVLVWGRKDPAFATALHDRLRARGVDVSLLLEYLPREAWAGRLGRAGVFVGVAKGEEGFYLPALEAMASGAAVVCADVTGNQSFAVDGETCLAPPHGDVAAHAAAVERLLANGTLAERLRTNGLARARAFSLERERAQFYAVLEELVFPRLAA